MVLRWAAVEFPWVWSKHLIFVVAFFLIVFSKLPGSPLIGSVRDLLPRWSHSLKKRKLNYSKVVKAFIFTNRVVGNSKIAFLVRHLKKLRTEDVSKLAIFSMLFFRT